MIAILLAPVYLLANYYLLRRVMGWVKAWFPFFRTARHWALPVAVQAFLACSIVIAFFLPEGRARRVMKLIGNYWLGVLLYVLLAVIAADLLRLLLGYVLPFKHIFVTTQMHRIAGCVCALVILIASIWGVVNARIIHVTPYDVTVDKTVEGMDEMKVVLVADLHLGYNIGEKQMQQMVDRINEQDADLVVIAGDIFDNEWEAVEAPETIAATLRSIRSKYGVYACYGNHDIEEPVLAGFTFRQSEKKESDPRMDEFLKDANITLLRDEGMLIDGKFYLYGRPDAHRPGRGIETRKTPDEITAGLDELTGEPDGRLLAVEVIRTEERNRILHFCMDEMNPDYREVLYLTYFEDMSYAQAAEVTGKTVKQITNMVYRGKESLRRLLEREGITNAES